MPYRFRYTLRCRRAQGLEAAGDELQAEAAEGYGNPEHRAQEQLSRSRPAEIGRAQRQPDRDQRRGDEEGAEQQERGLPGSWDRRTSPEIVPSA
jgi:hypothetical protein